MMAATVVPFGWPNIFKTEACFEESGAATLDFGIVDAAFGAAVGDDGAAARFLPGCFAGTFALRRELVCLELGLETAIWLPLMSTTASSAATDESPAHRQGHGMSAANILFSGKTVEQGCCILQSPGFVNQLLDVH
jgi:hypothetical protein